MKINLLASPPDAARPSAAISLEAKILRLVTRARERHAIQWHEIDAIIDPTSGRTLLLPNAQAALLEGKARFRSLVELTSDGYWEQDEQYRFVLHTGVSIGNELPGGESILGKRLWDLPFDNDTKIDWQTHRTQLEWRAVFRHLRLRCLDRTGKLHDISISGEPLFDSQGHFKGYRGITRARTEDADPRPDTPQADQFSRNVLDALTTQICVIDAAGTVLTVNAPWRRFSSMRGCLGAAVVEGGNYLTECDRSSGNERIDALTLAAGARQILLGERASFRHEYRCDTERTKRCWLSVNITPMEDAGAIRAIVAYQDITELRRREELLQLEHTVSSLIADNQDGSATVRGVIRVVCDALRWDSGRYFDLVPGTDVLCMTESWSTSTPAGESLPKDSPRVLLRPGAGIVGRVAQSGEPLWMVAGAHAEPISTTALAFEIGVADVFAFPVIASHEVCGVLAFAGSLLPAPDDRLLHTVRSIGLELGRYFERRRAEEALRRSEERLRRLIELSCDWTWQQDEQFRFTEIRGTSIPSTGNILGKTLWELPNMVRNEAEWSKHQSELEAHWSFCDFEIAVELADGQLGYYRISGEPTYDDAGIFKGFHGTGLDVTANKRSEIAARAASSSDR